MNSLLAISRSAADLLKRTPFHAIKVCAAIYVIVILSSVTPFKNVSAQTGATTIIHFDAPEFYDSQVVTSVSGVTFPSSPAIFSPDNVATFSPDFALHSIRPCEDGECTNKASELRMEFSQAVSEVSLYVGNDDSDAINKCFPESSSTKGGGTATCPVYARLIGYNRDGPVKDSGPVFITDATSDWYLANITTEISIKTSGNRIEYAILYTGTSAPESESSPSSSWWSVRVQIDELKYVVSSDPNPPAPTPPTITLTSPLAGQSMAYPYEIKLVGDVTAPGGLAAFCTSINEPVIPSHNCNEYTSVKPGGAFNTLMTDTSRLKPTNNTIYVFAYDQFGQLGQAQVPITLQTPPAPTIKIFSPRFGEQYEPRWEEPYWAAQINTPGGLAAFCTRSNEKAIPPLEQCNQTNDVSKYGGFVRKVEPSSLKLGDNTLYAFAYDRWGQIATASVSFKMPIDLRITAMEITQGIQSQQIPLNTNGVARYSGATLVKRGKTVVRVFANAVAGGYYDASAQLCTTIQQVVGTRIGDWDVCIAPDNKGVVLGPGGIEPTLEERADPNSAFVFTLPPSWTAPGNNAIYLRAGVGSSSRPECVGCSKNNTFTVIDIRFVDRDSITISPVEIRWTNSNGAEIRPSHPFDVFQRTVAISPLPERGLIISPDWAGTIDVTNFVTDNSTTLSPGHVRCDTACRNRIFEKVAEFEKNNLKGYTIGVSRGLDIGLEAPVTYARFPTGLVWEPIAIVDQGPRPLTIVTHEFYHQLAYYHAGTLCPNNNMYISWPPDDRGLIQGIGLDRRPNSGPLPGTYRIIAPGILDIQGKPTEYFDLMSYCANGDANAWISLRNWNAFGSPLPNGPLTQDMKDYIAIHRVFSRAEFEDMKTSLIEPTNKATLRLLGIDNTQGQVTILRVEQGSGEFVTTDYFAESPYRLVARDVNGNEISSHVLLPLLSTGTHGDALSVTLVTEIPSEDVGALEIQYEGQTVAERIRSTNAPEVNILAPLGGAHISGSNDVIIQWESEDVDGDQLESRIEYSTDNGQTYRVLTTGVQGNQVSLPARLFTGSKQSRIRLTVNDGFNDGVAISDVFSVEGFPPQVQIIEPIKNMKIYSDVGLRLVGQAFDDSNELISDEQMRWFADEDQIGTGSVLDGPKLPAGIHKVRLEATDAQGRIGSLTVNVEVLPAPTVPTAPVVPTPLSWLWIAIIGALIVCIAVLIIIWRRQSTR